MDSAAVAPADVMHDNDRCLAPLIRKDLHDCPGDSVRLKYASSMEQPVEKRKIHLHDTVEAYGPSLSDIEITIESIVDASQSSTAMKRKGSHSPISEILGRYERPSELEKQYDTETYVRLAEAGARWKALILHLDVVEESLQNGPR